MCEIEEQTKFYNSKAEKTGWQDFIRLDFISLTAFTMAEILISLTIIGVIAAITLPSLKANINEKTWATQRKALYSRMSQAISMMPSLNGYGKYSGEWDDDNGNVSVIADTAAQAFITEGLAKVLEISNICSFSADTQSKEAREELKKCGISSHITTMANQKIGFPTKLSELNSTFFETYTVAAGTLTNPQRNIDTVTAALNTKHGESLAVFYNPNCISYESRVSNTIGNTIIDSYYPQPHMCVNFIYDLNGTKGPNEVGKDIGFMTALYPTDSVLVAPLPLNKLSNNGTTIRQNKAAAACRRQDPNSRVPNIEELQSLYVNKDIFGFNDALWSSSVSSVDNTKAWYMQIRKGVLGLYYRKAAVYLWCVKR